MDAHLKLLERFQEGNITGRLWKASYFDAEGLDLGTCYELELVNQGLGESHFRCDGSELRDCLHIIQQAVLYVKQRADEYPVGEGTYTL